MTAPSAYAKRAKQKTRATPIAIKRGLPKSTGVGQLAIATNLPTGDKRWKAVKRYAKSRKAATLRFRELDVTSIRRSLAKIGPEFVAFAVAPETLDVNFHYSVLELCRDLDDDPMPDFHFGYLVTQDASDMEAWLARIEARHQAPLDTPKAKVVALRGNGSQLRSLDMLLHFGHGMPTRVQGGMTGEQVGALKLERAPVVWSGACFNAVVSRSFHKSAFHMVWSPPVSVDPKKCMATNWIHAGALGFLAALEGDRGEMASVEWEYLRREACSLGEAIGHQYRLATTSFYADFTRFPRHVNRHKKRMSFYDVMLRGAVSRVLFGDPSLKPITSPLDKPTQTVSLEQDTSASTSRSTIKIRVDRRAQSAHQNYLPKSGKGVFDARITARVALPEDWSKPLPVDAAVTLVTNGKSVEITRHQIRHEVWGGRRFVNLQIESPPGSVKKGSVATFVFED